MFIKLWNIIDKAICLNGCSHIIILPMLIRCFIVFIFGITLARFNKKLMGIRTPFNFTLFVMLGSLFANAIIDERVFIPTLTAILFFVALNGLLTILAFYFASVETFIKGISSILVKDGVINWHAMRKNFITEQELINELQRQLHTTSLKNVQYAELASDGSINFVTYSK